MTPQEIAEVRLELGLTQQQFSTLLGVGKFTVSMWESGRRPIGTKVAKTVQYFVALKRVEGVLKEHVDGGLKGPTALETIGSVIQQIFPDTAAMPTLAGPAKPRRRRKPDRKNKRESVRRPDPREPETRVLAEVSEEEVVLTIRRPSRE